MNKILRKFIIPLALIVSLLGGINTSKVHALSTNIPVSIDVDYSQLNTAYHAKTYAELNSIAKPVSSSNITSSTTEIGTLYVPRDYSQFNYDDIYSVQYGSEKDFYKIISISAVKDDPGKVSYGVYVWYTKNGSITGAGVFSGSGTRSSNPDLYQELLAYQQEKENNPLPSSSGKNYNVTRLSGLTRLDTARAIADNYNSGTVKNVILASGLNYPDAMSATTLSDSLKAPILLVGLTPVESVTSMDYIQKHLDKSGTVYILGGQGAVNETFVVALNLLGYHNIKRLYGSTRYDTCNAINRELVTEGYFKQGIAGDKANKKNIIFLVSGNGFADGLSVGSIAASLKVPVILCDTNTISDDTLNLIKDIATSKGLGKPSIQIIGGPSLISDNVVTTLKNLGYNTARLYGQNRYQTSMGLTEAFYLNNATDDDLTTVCFASGENFPDALTGGALAKKNNAHLILVNNDASNLQTVKKYIDSFSRLTNEIIFGGTGAVSKYTEQYLSK